KPKRDAFWLSITKFHNYPITKSSRQCNHKRRHHQVRNRQRQQKLPSKGHQLVISKTWQRATHPDVNKKKYEHPQDKPEQRQQLLQPVWTKHWSAPSAQKQQRRQARNSDHVGVLCHEKHRKFHGAVLGVIARDQLGFRLWQVKWNAIRLRVGRRQIDKEGNDMPATENEPIGNESPDVYRLGNNEATQTEGAGQNQNAD